MEEQKIREIIEEIPQYKVNKIANEVAIRIINVFTELKKDYEIILKKLEQCKIKIVKFEDENVTHYFSNNTIYFSNIIYVNSINEEIILEYLHYLQQGKDNNYFNEALNQYATKLLMQDLKERMNVFGIFLSSLIEGNFSLLVNLIMQINFLVGKNEFIQTVINSKDDYYVLLNKISNGNMHRLIKDFEKLYNLELEYTITDDIYKVRGEIKSLYFEIQNYIMKFYFYYKTIYITELNEIEEIKQKLEEIQTYRGVIEEDKFYTEESKKIIERLNDKEKTFKKRKSKNSIAIIYSNKFLAFIKKILSFNH